MRSSQKKSFHNPSWISPAQSSPISCPWPQLSGWPGFHFLQANDRGRSHIRFTAFTPASGGKPQQWERGRKRNYSKLTFDHLISLADSNTSTKTTSADQIIASLSFICSVVSFDVCLNGGLLLFAFVVLHAHVKEGVSWISLNEFVLF